MRPSHCQAGVVITLYPEESGAQPASTWSRPAPEWQSHNPDLMLWSTFGLKEMSTHMEVGTVGEKDPSCGQLLRAESTEEPER